MSSRRSKTGKQGACTWYRVAIADTRGATRTLTGCIVPRAAVWEISDRYVPEEDEARAAGNRSSQCRGSRSSPRAGWAFWGCPPFFAGGRNGVTSDHSRSVKIAWISRRLPAMLVASGVSPGHGIRRSSWRSHENHNPLIPFNYFGSGPNEAKNSFGSLLDTARAVPVTIWKHGRRVVVVVSTEETERLLNPSGRKKATKYKEDDRRAIRVLRDVLDGLIVMPERAG